MPIRLGVLLEGLRYFSSIGTTSSHCKYSAELATLPCQYDQSLIERYPIDVVVARGTRPRTFGRHGTGSGYHDSGRSGSEVEQKSGQLFVG